MKNVARAAAVLVVAMMMVLGSAGTAWSKPASCDKAGNCVPASNLQWRAPSVIVDNVPGSYSSVQKCPTTRPDGSPLQGNLMVQVTLLLSSGGGAGQLVAANPDGSWSATLSWNMSGTVDPNATITASCQDVTFTGTILGNYRTFAVSLNPAA
jgi:hypothetical protein